MEEEYQAKKGNDVFKCPQCGANLKYEIETKSLFCEFCDYHLKLSEEKSDVEHSFSEIDDAAKTRWDHSVKKANCKNCGAEVIIDSNLLTVECPFCNTSMVVSDEEIQGIKPDRVIPFVVSSQVCIGNYQKWIKRKVFAPTRLKKELPNPSLFSTYIPTWTYDTDVFASYNGRLGKKYQVRVGSGKDAHYETRIRYFRVSGVYQLKEDDVLVNSGNSINQKEIQSIEPFNTNESIVYDNRYLAGHSCEHYKMDVKDGWKVAQSIIMQDLKNGILSQYDYDVIDYLNIYPTYSNITYKYVIIPIWLCHFLYNKKKYRFIANGENGKISGKYPKSPVKISILVLVILAIIIALIIIYIKKYY